MRSRNSCNQTIMLLLIYGLVAQVLLAAQSEQHYIYLPVVSNAHFYPQDVTWVVHHPPTNVHHPVVETNAGSRETIEEHSAEEVENQGGVSIEQSKDDEQQTVQEPEEPSVQENVGQEETQEIVPEDDGQVQVSETDDSQTKEPAPEENEVHKGMPYSYNYETPHSSKSETADDQGNVKGEYSYLDGAGVMRKVTYTVNGDEGFVAKGDIHPDPGSEPAPSNDVPVKGGERPTPRPSKGAPPPSKGASPQKPIYKSSVPKPGPGTKSKGSWGKYPLGG